MKEQWLYPWWRHQMETFSALLALCAGNSPVPVNSPHKGQWRGALMFSLIYAWINDWVNNREADDLRRQRSHHDVIVMIGENPTLTWHMDNLLGYIGSKYQTRFFGKLNDFSIAIVCTNSCGRPLNYIPLKANKKGKCTGIVFLQWLHV